MKKQNKRGAVGETVVMIYRLVLITFIALVILGTAAIFYDFYVDVRNVEATILTNKVVNCLTPNGTLDLDSFPKDKEKSILDYCGIKDTERFYVKATVREDFTSQDIKVLEHGDSGFQWIKDYFEKTKYEPGTEPSVFYVDIINSNQNFRGVLLIKVLVAPEF